MRTVQGRVQRPEGSSGSFAGHRVLLTYRRLLDSGGTDDTSVSPLEIAEAAGAPLTGDGTFSLTIPDEKGLRDALELAVLAPAGTLLNRTPLRLEQLSSELHLSCAPAQPFVVRRSRDPSLGQSRRLTGRVIGMDGTPAAAGLNVVIWGLTDESSTTPQPLLSTHTQLGGYFAAPWPVAELHSAYGEINGTSRTAIGLAEARLPNRLVLVVALPPAPADDCECAPTPPRAPDVQDLVANPAAYSQDLGGGCVSLTMPNRVLEEYAYFMIVRTTEPDVRPMNTDPPTRLPTEVLTALTTLVGVQGVQEAVSPEPAGFGASIPASVLSSLDTKRAVEMLASPEKINAQGLAQAALKAAAVDLRRMVDQLNTKPVRSELDARNAIDWDLSPTIYEAVTVALGHVLHYRQTWRADGYSLGDLLYSLPLAPGQKRYISVLDWTRRSTASRSEFLESEEQMLALTERDRDVSEIVNSHLDERMDGGSTSSSRAAGGGIGGGLFGGTFGVLAGVAGGSSGANSSSWQDSARTLSGSSLQQLRDRTSQRASAVRNSRSTVIQTVAQDESTRVETEVVANYNHCHALTVEYFEVLRHFQVSEELASVSECVFVPLPMYPFDQPKARRWRTALQPRLRRPDLMSGFDAIERIATNWDGWDFPEQRFSEEAPEELDGELRLRFVIPRPHDKVDGAFDIDRWRWLTPLLWHSPFALFNLMASHVNGLFRDINRALTAEFYTQIQRARDAYFAREVAPRLAEQIVHHLRFAYVTRSGAQVTLPLEASLVSKYVDGIPLYVSVRPAGALPALPREEIARLRIYLAPNLFGVGEVPAEARVLVTSGRMRYRTPHLTGLLFDDSRINNDLGNGDHVVIATPTSRAERRDPRADDRRRADELVAHLNEQLEYYHQVLWMTMDPQRRYMLLDGILAPNADGRSVASVVENRLIGIVGNCLVLPVTPGISLDPTLAPDPETGERLDLVHAYATAPPPPTRISVPTRGVYAEAIMGDCNACEAKDDTRFWRWEESPLPDEPTLIEPISTASRQEAPPDATPTPLPPPIVNIQSAPGLPDPMGLGQALEILGRADIFRDASGLAGTQRNALSAFQGVMDTARAFGGMAAQLAQQQEMGRNVDRTLEQIKRAQDSGMLSPQQAQSLAHSALQALVGDPGVANQHPVHDPEVSRAIEKAVESPTGSVTVTSPGETVHASFGDERVGGTAPVTLAAEKIELAPWINVPLEIDGVIQGKVRQYQPGTTTTSADDLHNVSQHVKLNGADVDIIDIWPALTSAPNSPLRADPSGNGDFQLRLRMRVVYPIESGKPGVVEGKGRKPLVLLMHGNHASWKPDGPPKPAGPAFNDMVSIKGKLKNTKVTPFVIDKLKVSDSYAGYAFLQDYLARHGIISVSIDANFCNFFDSHIKTRADLFVKALDELTTESARKGSALEDRIDFDNIGLMGHSRGGDAVVAATKAIRAKSPTHYTVKAICSLAPTDFTGGMTVTKRMVLEEADTGFYLVVYGGLDGDVSGFDGPAGSFGTGFRHYDRARCQKAMVFIKKACHNSFNSVWHGDGLDNSDPRMLDPNSKIPPVTHQTLAQEYIGELFRWKLLKHKLAGRFDGRNTNSAGADVSLQWMFGAPLKRLEDFEQPGANLVGGTRAVFKPAPHIVEIRDENQISQGGAPGTLFGIHMPHQSHMLQMEWAPVPARQTGIRAMTSDIPSAHKDWSTFDTLILGIGGWYKPDDDASIAAEWLPRVRVILIDGAGGSAIADFSQYGDKVPSRPIHAEKRDWNSKGTPLINATLMPRETVAIPLKLFSGVDLHQVTQLVLELEPAGIVTAFVDDIHILKRET